MTISHLERDPGRRSATIRLAEHERVRLTDQVQDRSGIYEIGSTGTVVYVHGGGSAYEVEITHPLHAVVTVQSSSLERAPL